jgi:hypothetical protein
MPRELTRGHDILLRGQEKAKLWPRELTRGHDILLRGHEKAKSLPWDINRRETKFKGMFSNKGTIRMHNYNGTSIKIKQKQLMFFFIGQVINLIETKYEEILT